MKVVEINDVFKTYHDTEVEVKAVNGVTLSFEKGDFAVIVGPSGSGKTTLLNLIGGDHSCRTQALRTEAFRTDRLPHGACGIRLPVVQPDTCSHGFRECGIYHEPSEMA